MKRYFLFSVLLPLLLLLLLLLPACDTRQTPGDDGSTSSTDPTLPVGNFTVEANQRVVYTTDETGEIRLCVTGADIDGGAVTYQLLSGSNAATVDGDGVLTFADTSLTVTVTVQAVIDGKVSANTLSLYRLRDRRDRFADAMRELKPEELDLWETLPLPLNLPPEAFLVDAGGCATVTLSAESPSLMELTVVGLAKQQPLVIRDLDGDVYWSGTLDPVRAPIGRAVYDSAIACGIATAETPCITAERLAELSALSLCDLSPEAVADWGILNRFPALVRLDLSGSTVFDLSFLEGRQLTHLTLDRLPLFDLTGSERFLSVIDSLTALESLSVCGTLGVLDRSLCAALIDRARAGDFALTVLSDLVLGPQSPDGFLDSVFFSLAELEAHLAANGHRLVAAEGYSHAILSLANNSEDRLCHINVGDITTLELYGNREHNAFSTPLSATGDLTLNLYNYHIYMHANRGDAIVSTGSLSLNAYYGLCGATGGNSVWWTDATGTWCSENGSAIRCRDLTLYASPRATVTFRGGTGNVGNAGKADGSNPASATSGKHAGEGLHGKPAIYADGVTVLGGAFHIFGGQGGPGGKGGDGTSEHMVNGGYNGGNGGKGGNGGAGIVCTSYTVAEGASVSVTGGLGGDGGGGGEGYLFGSDGNTGGGGVSGGSVVYR